MMQVEAVLGSLSTSVRKGGFMSPFGSGNGHNTSSNSKTEHQSGREHELNGHNSTSATNSSSISTGSKSCVTAQVIFLDDSSHVFDLDKKAKGSALLDAVFDHLDLHEREYFGLMFHDTGAAMPNGHSPDVMRWLDPAKHVRKQVRNRYLGGSSGLNDLLSPFNTLDNRNKDADVKISNVITFYFRVKFYVTDPSRLHEEMTRYHVYLQVKKDIIEGRLSAPFSTLCLLTSYVAQAVLGDYEYDTCRPGYLAQFRDLRKHCVSSGNAGPASNLSQEDIERRIAELHKLHKNQPPSEAEINFLEHAKRLEMYGISLHNGKDSHGRDIQLGVTCIGLVVFQNQVKINTFSWSKIVKISFKRKQFFIQLRKELTESYDTLLGFNLASYRSCKNLWKSAVEHHSFFRLHSPKVAPRRFLMSLGSKFRYSGRTEFQTHGVQTGGSGPSKGSGAGASKFPRSTLSRKTLPLNLETRPAQAVAVTAGGEGKAPKLASPETSSIGSSVHSATGGLKPKPNAPPIAISNGQSKPNRGQDLNGSSWSQTSSSTSQSLAHRAIESFNNKVQSLSTKLPKKVWQEEVTSDDEGGFLDTNRRISSLGRLTKASSASPQTTSIHKHLSLTPTSLSLSKPSVRLAYADESSLSDRASVEATNSLASGFSSGSSVRKTPGPGALPISMPAAPAAAAAATTVTVRSPKPAPPPLILTTTTSPATSSFSSGKLIGTPPTLGAAGRGRPPTLELTKDDDQAAEESNGGLVFITIVPDDQGRFGFNVKGGVDQKLPIIVSRVGSNTPADKCYPKLNEGDQVVLINGRDVSSHTHDQVVNFIRASSEPHSGQLILAVKQNAYLSEDVEEEPDFEYVPESPSPSILKMEGKAQGALLSQSMMLLEESLSSGAIIGQFEQLYRRNPSLAMSICHSQDNMAKNRYRDISPYDSTRVLLSECPTGDYINANHVIMNIPGSGIVNRYIATQGPLASTCTDFWYMTWESQSSLIIMLTTIVERGRIKCHQYWPDLDETLEYGRLKVTCVKDDGSAKSFAFRDFVVEDTETEEIRHITQMAYLSWPDHGVPDNDDEFVDFVEKVRVRRQGDSLCPTVVHCSAGIGRTGVLILMESALYLIEANQPVYPLELTRIMRDQRASMIQTPAQYRFVCQAILRVFQGGQVKPLPEFCSAAASDGSSASSTTSSTGKSKLTAVTATPDHEALPEPEEIVTIVQPKSSPSSSSTSSLPAAPS